jgi:hypothetical protein
MTLQRDAGQALREDDRAHCLLGDGAAMRIPPKISIQKFSPRSRRFKRLERSRGFLSLR